VEIRKEFKGGEEESVKVAEVRARRKNNGGVCTRILKSS